MPPLGNLSESSELLIHPSNKASFPSVGVILCGRRSALKAPSDKATDGKQVGQRHSQKQEYKTRWHIQLWWWRGIHKSPISLIDSTTSVISSKHLISAVRHVFVDWKADGAQRPSYSYHNVYIIRMARDLGQIYGGAPQRSFKAHTHTGEDDIYFLYSYGFNSWDRMLRQMWGEKAII